ncbi:hypothetical protein [Uliginosibacterium sp. H1]|uniref:hypothetical protein n=1 Tax=Uliginosibacterium sp. H1 TaxID=3114757 RepID=UPI002E17BF14|nr:hypothetical protein [Uliginosibacterium sp. H1]
MKFFSKACIGGVALLSLAGCGLTETATTAGTVAAGKAEEVKRGQEQIKQVQQQLDQINAQAAQRLQEADQAAGK